MYILLLILLLGFSVFIIIRGSTLKRTPLVALGITLGIITLLFFWFMSFWGEMLWFKQLDYNERFWKLWLTKIGLFIAGFLISALIVMLLTYSLKNGIKYFRQLAVVLGGIIGGTWWFTRWDIFLKFINKVPTTIHEPILNMSTSFYLFDYPFYLSIYQILLILSIISIGASFIGILKASENSNEAYTVNEELSPAHSIYISVGFALLILGLGKYLRRFGLLFSQHGVVFGPGWTDDHIRLPLLLTISIVTIIAGFIMFVPSLRKRLYSLIRLKKSDKSVISQIFAIPGFIFLLWLIFLIVVPLLFQWLKVEPNELRVEKPYIVNNVNFTREGFKLNTVEVNEFPVSEDLSELDVEKNENIFSNIRLWDYRALDDVFKQFQEIRLYYEFADVDIDRYTIDSTYRQVMISAREMNPDNLPIQSQTFINKRFNYTHGYGIVLNKVNEFTPEGLPNLLIKDIPPVSKFKSLEVTRPELYYGELSLDYVIVNTKEEEFDYPSGEDNIYAHYKGNGGIPISNAWRKVLFGWKYGGTKFLFSGYPTKESRIMIHRQIRDRIKNIAPFLYFDDDPYIVLSNGNLYWILDAYTSTEYYPYSEPYVSDERIGYPQESNIQGQHNLINQSLIGKNYIRNSVKIVVNAYNGDVDLYIFDKEDPLIQVYDKIFPGLFKNENEMPKGLRKHVRYPSDMLLVQGLTYTKYHMTDPTVFYNQEDLWVRATENYYGKVQPVEPYYIMWEQPGSTELEFVLMLPFTPKDKQVMIGWIAGMCDGDNYGRFLAYNFPKEKRVLGTQQMETKIDQDSYLSGQLTLWDQRGSNVIRGNVLVIPIDKTILYVEPIYLRSQTAAYPELRLVAIMHDDQLSYAETFNEALNNLLKGEKPVEIGTAKEGFSISGSVNELIQKANNAFEDYLDFMQQKKFNEAGNSLEELQKTLQKLSDQTKK